MTKNQFTIPIPYLKLSKNRTIFFSNGTIVPPDVTTATGPLNPPHSFLISLFKCSLILSFSGVDSISLE